MPLAITLGYQANGRHAEPIVLYCGLDAGKGKDIANAPSKGIVRTEFFKNPAGPVRKFFPAEVSAPEPVAGETAEPAPAPSKKK